MITYFFRSTKDKKIIKRKVFRPGAWILVENPGITEIKNLAKRFSVKEDLLKDALDIHEVPRIEKDEKGITYVFVRTPIFENGNIITNPILLAIGSDFIMTLYKKRVSFLEKFVKGKIDFFTTQRAKLFFQIFFEINLQYGEILNNIRRDMLKVSVNVRKVNNENVVQFVIFENAINEFLSVLIPLNTVLETLLSGKFFAFYEKDRDLIEDLYLSNRQLIELSKSNLKTIVNIRDAYSTILTNNLNRTIKLLTSLTIIFTIPTIVASFYGMNVSLPLQTNSYSFWFILLITGIISLFLLFIFKKKDWL